jgi:O-antigen ligase
VLQRSALAWVGALGVVALVEVTGGWGARVPVVGRLVGGSELLAIHLTLWFPLGLAIALCAAGASMAGIGSWLAVAAGAFALLASYSRSGWVGGLVASLVVLGCLLGSERRRIASVLLVGMLILAAAAALVALSGWSPPGVPAAYVERLGTLARSGLFADRSEEWQRALPVLRSAPLFGSPAAPNCYNLILGLASRHGLPILVPFAALVAMAMMGAWRGRGRQRGAAAGVLGALAGLLVTGIGEASLGARVMPEAMAVLGAGSALAVRERSVANAVEGPEPTTLG